MTCGEVASKEELAEAQKEGEFCQQALGQLVEIAVNTENADRQIIEHLDSYLLGEDGLLLRCIPTIYEDEGNKSSYRVLISRKLWKRFIGYSHDSVLTGHNSHIKTFRKL